jgi:pimeloyl-ACP methyl ester carboxylesterase
MTQPSHRTIKTNGIQMHIAEQGSGPLVLMCHGFPESWYSWRHQLTTLAGAGYHAVAPDMRGYGQTEQPEGIDQYTLLHLVGDMVGVLDALGAETAVIAGHDWGAPVAWHCALLRPDRFRAVIGLSVPYRGRGPVRPTTVMPQTETALFYQLLPDAARRRSGTGTRSQEHGPSCIVRGFRQCVARHRRCVRGRIRRRHGGSEERPARRHDGSARAAALADCRRPGLLRF